MERVFIWLARNPIFHIRLTFSIANLKRLAGLFVFVEKNETTMQIDIDSQSINIEKIKKYVNTFGFFSIRPDEEGGDGFTLKACHMENGTIYFPPDSVFSDGYIANILRICLYISRATGKDIYTTINAIAD